MRDILSIEDLSKLDIALYLCCVVVKQGGKWCHRESGEEIDEAYYTSEFEIQEWEYYDHNTALVPESDIDWNQHPLIVVDTKNNCLLDTSIETGVMVGLDGHMNVYRWGEEYVEGRYKTYLEVGYER